MVLFLTEDDHFELAGTVIAIVMGISATLGNLSSEVIVKHSTKDSKGLEQSVFMQNLILYAYTTFTCLMIWLGDVSIQQEAYNVFSGWDERTCVLVLFQVQTADDTRIVSRALLES